MSAVRNFRLPEPVQLAAKPRLVWSQAPTLYTPDVFDRDHDLRQVEQCIKLTDPEDFLRNRLWAYERPSDAEFERFVQALRWGDAVAIARVRAPLRRREAFSSYLEAFFTGTGTITAPQGAFHGIGTGYGGGGGGARDVTNTAGGGGGGGKVNFKCQVHAGDTLNYSVGAKGTGRTGTNGVGTAGGNTTSSSGAGGFSGVAIAANGGGGGNNGVSPANTGGLGGAASGETSNAAHQNGTAGDAGQGGGLGGGGGRSGGGSATWGDYDGGTTTGTGGGGGAGGENGVTTTTAGGDGGRGQFQITWYGR